jgi:hypothetical protein
MATAKKEDDSTRVYHISKRDVDGMWQVKFAGGEKAIKLFKTQKEALEYTKVMAKNQEGKILTHATKGEHKGKIRSAK